MYEVGEFEREGSKFKTLTDASNERLWRSLKEGDGESEDIFEFCANEKVEYLDLDERSLTTAPESISRITSLTELHLWGNRLTALPSSFNQLQHLELLRIDTNSIETFPLVIFQMTSLKKLALGFNKLQSIPVSIGNLVNLEELYLPDNSISKLPVSFHKLSNLDTLNMDGNPLVFPPYSMIHEDYDAQEEARKVVAYMKLYHNSRHLVIQMLSLQRCRDRKAYLSSRFSYSQHTPFAVFGTHLFRYFLENYILNECDDEDWPQTEEERREKRELWELEEEEEEEDDSSSSDCSESISSASYSYEEDDE